MTETSTQINIRIKTQIRQFLGRHLRGYEVRDDEDVFASGYVNSLFTMQLVLFVEREFGLAVADEDLERSNFCSVDALAAFVARKRAAPEIETAGR